MRNFKLAMAAGASLVAVAKFSPAYALPVNYPLDVNGPIRQGNMCLALSGARESRREGGYGHAYFYECAPARHASTTAHKHAHRHARETWVVTAALHSNYWLDPNGPIRQGNMCLGRNIPIQARYEGGYGRAFFYECEPARHVAEHRHHRHHHHRHAHHHGRYHHGHHQHAHHHAAVSRQHGHQRHALHHGSNIPATQVILEQNPSHLSYDAGDIVAFHGTQPFSQPIQDVGSVVMMTYDSPGTGGRIDPIGGAVGETGEPIRLAALASTDAIAAIGRGGVAESATDVGNGYIAIVPGIRRRSPVNGEWPAQLVGVARTSASSPRWGNFAISRQVPHAMICLASSECFAKSRSAVGEPRPSADPAMGSLFHALGQRSYQPRPQAENDDVNRAAVSRGLPGDPARAQASGNLSATTKENGYAPIAVVLGLAVLFSSTLALVGTQIPSMEKVPAYEVVSDIVAVLD